MSQDDIRAYQSPAGSGNGEGFDLLYPPGSSSSQSATRSTLPSASWHDLGLEHIVAGFTGRDEYKKDIEAILSQLICDPEVIRYRQDVLEDLLRNPGIAERFNSLLPVIDSLTAFSFHFEREMNSLHEVTWRLGELQCILECIEGVHGILHEVQDKLSSQGLHLLLTHVEQAKADPTYQNLVKELPELLEKLRSCASITVGINLDGKLQPIQATLLAVNKKPFTTQSLMNKLFGSAGDNEGIAPLHSVPQRYVQGPYTFPIDPELGWEMEPMMIPLFADLAKVLEKTTIPIAKRLKQYSGLQSDFITQLRHSLVFYLGAIRFIHRVEAMGLPLCRPEILPASDRRCNLQDFYNVNLALRMENTTIDQDLSTAVTTNNVDIGPQGNILILTGPNQGGKTTFTVGIGIAQALAQVGCFVPAAKAQISLVDNIYTHFPLEEKPEAETGRFGEEAMRLQMIFAHLTRDSLVLMNESLSNTSFGESLYLAVDVVRILGRVGARTIYSTHLHELASKVDDLNQELSAHSKIISVVSSPIDTDMDSHTGEVKRSYKVVVRPPMGQSYAREIAARYGISYDQLEKSLSERGVL